MKSFILILISLIVSGLEPFWPLGSPVIALAAALGTKYPNSTGIFAAVFIGLARDVLLVNRLGASSLIAAFAWFIAAFAAARLGRPLAVSVFAAGISAIAANLNDLNNLSYLNILIQVLATAALAGIFSAVWNFVSERDETIKVKKS